MSTINIEHYDISHNITTYIPAYLSAQCSLLFSKKNMTNNMQYNRLS